MTQSGGGDGGGESRVDRATLEPLFTLDPLGSTLKTDATNT